MTQTKRYLSLLALTAVVLFGLIAACAKLHGAQEPAKLSVVRVKEIRIRPTSDMSGRSVTCAVTAWMEEIFYLPSGVIERRDVGPVEFDLVRTRDSVTVSGQVREYHAIASAMIQAALDEWRIVERKPAAVTPPASPPPPAALPERKTVRSE